MWRQIILSREIHFNRVQPDRVQCWTPKILYGAIRPAGTDLGDCWTPKILYETINSVTGSNRILSTSRQEMVYIGYVRMVYYKSNLIISLVLVSCATIGGKRAKCVFFDKKIQFSNIDNFFIFWSYIKKLVSTSIYASWNVHFWWFLDTLGTSDVPNSTLKKGKNRYLKKY